MNYLAVDTAAGSLKILLAYNGKRYYFEDKSFKSASVRLMPETDRLLNAAGAKLSEMDCFACVTGPGSFTGIRIGLATIKAFAYVFGKPVIEVNSLQLLAFSSLAETTVAVCDASSGLRYIAVYNESGKEIMKPNCLNTDELASFLELLDEPYSVVTDEVSAEGVYGAIVPTSFEEAFEKAVLFNMDKAKDGNLVEPLYIRKPQAVIDLENKQK